MKNSLYADKIAVYKEILRVKAKIKEQEQKLFALQAENSKVDTAIHADMRLNNLAAYRYDDYEFTLATEVTTTILESVRKDAIKYDNKFRVGLFRLQLNGMVLKAWVKDLLEKNLKVPDFVSYQDYKRVHIKPVKTANGGGYCG